jgi:hypothetical protein
VIVRPGACQKDLCVFGASSQVPTHALLLYEATEYLNAFIAYAKVRQAAHQGIASQAVF